MKHPTSTELQQYCDGDLSASVLPAVQSHLDACPACAAFVAQELVMLRALQRSPYTAPGPDFEQRVLTQLSGQGVSIATDQRWISRYAALLIGMAGTLAVVLFSMVVGTPRTNTRSSFFDSIAQWLAPLLDAVPLPSIQFNAPQLPEYGGTLQLFATVLGVLLALAALDRFVLQPLLRPHARGQRGIAPDTRGQ